VDRRRKERDKKEEGKGTMTRRSTMGGGVGRNWWDERHRDRLQWRGE